MPPFEVARAPRHRGGRRPTTTVEWTARTLRITLTRQVEVPPAQLWPYLVIPAAMNTWSLAQVTPVAPGPGGAYDEAGARRRVRVHALVGEFLLDEEILASEFPRRLVYRVTKGFAVKRHLGEMTVRGDERSELRWQVDIDFVFPGAPLIAERILVPQLERSVDQLGRAALGGGRGAW
jgi:uncharacterized protein YndB with AHSA1/START domain